LFKPKSEVCNVTRTIAGESLLFIIYQYIYTHSRYC
jgi:hypothetical protein